MRADYRKMTAINASCKKTMLSLFTRRPLKIGHLVSYRDDLTKMMQEGNHSRPQKNFPYTSHCMEKTMHLSIGENPYFYRKMLHQHFPDIVSAQYFQGSSENRRQNTLPVWEREERYPSAGRVDASVNGARMQRKAFKQSESRAQGATATTEGHQRKFTGRGGTPERRTVL